ncbi:hypothetical protein V7147_07505 [Bacillus sp. JJ1521]|uniref:hypothetical protein n=1 Tax=Bacillus sp. JJ1521 TaxID=3122957 RepID=UPI002FFE7BDE
MLDQIKNEKKKLREEGLIKEFQKIRLLRIDTEEDELVEVDNPTDLPLLFRHNKYAVFQLDTKRCIKIFTKEGYAEKEYTNLRLGADKGISPEVYGWGEKFLVTENIGDTNARKHVELHGITRELTEKLIQLLRMINEEGFMTNHALEDIIILPDGTLKVMKLKKNLISKPSFPKKIIKGLGEKAPMFLQLVFEVDKSLFEEWRLQPEFTKYDQGLE